MAIILPSFCIFLKKGIKITLKNICQCNQQNDGGIAVSPLYLAESAATQGNSNQLQPGYDIGISQVMLLTKPFYICSYNRLIALHDLFIFHTYSVLKKIYLKFLKWTQMQIYLCYY